MKKFLSLVLALAMTLSLVTISAGAKDFADSDELSGEQYEEAVNVMSEMGIIDGYAGGDFQPQGTLTRGAAAKIIACMMLGKTTAEALGTQAAPFKDVPAGSTFAGYIAYCVESGLIDGYADGTFRPGNTLTGFAFLKMLLTALGYDSSIEGYTGTNWTVNVAGRATQIGLTDGNEDFVGTRAATREEACLYAVNALKATLVEYENKGQEITVSDGTVITVRPSAPTYVTSNIAGAATSIDDTYDNTRQDYTVEFAEKYQPDLELDHDIDVFGRPSHTWSWKGDEIGSYVDYDLMIAEYTTEVTGRDLYDAIGRNILNDDDYDFYISIDGETEEKVLNKNGDDYYFTAGNLVRGNTDGIGGTDNGVLTQVFVDTNSKEVYIAVINTYLAVATDDYDERKDELSLDIYAIDNVGSKSAKAYIKNLDTPVEIADEEISGEDFDIVDYVDGDIILVNVADGEVQAIADPEILDAVTLNAFKVDSYVETDGTRYDYASTAKYDPAVLDVYTTTGTVNLKDLTYNVILDPYGYMIGIEQNEDPDQYVFVTGVDGNYSNLSTRTADMAAIFEDGSMKTIEVNVRKSDPDLFDKTEPFMQRAWNGTGSSVYSPAILNVWCTYTVDSDGVYTLQIADNQSRENVNTGDTVTIDVKHITRDKTGGGYVVGNDDSVYINVDLETIDIDDGVTAKIIDDVDSVTTGVKNVNVEITNKSTGSSSKDYVPTYEIFTLYDDNNYIIACITMGEDQGTSSDYAYVTSDKVAREEYSSEADTWTWTREVVINGELTEISYLGDAVDVIDEGDGTGDSDNEMDQGYWYKVTYYADGTVKETEALAPYFKNPSGVATKPYSQYGDEFIEAPANIEKSFDQGNFDTAVFWYDAQTSDQLRFENGSLYVSVTDHNGISVHPEVKVVLANAGGKNQAQFHTVEDGYTGYDGLEDAIDDLNDNFDGQVSAILENGMATSIIINCTAQDTGFNGGSNTGSAGDIKSVALKNDATGNIVVDVTLTGTVSAVTYTEVTVQRYMEATDKWIDVAVDVPVGIGAGYDHSGDVVVLNNASVVAASTYRVVVTLDGAEVTSTVLTSI